MTVLKEGGGGGGGDGPYGCVAVLQEMWQSCRGCGSLAGGVAVLQGGGGGG